MIHYAAIKYLSREVNTLVDVVEWPAIGMTLEEAAKALRVDTRTLRTLIKAGDFPARKVGVGWRIDPEAVKRWLAKKPATAETEDDE